jgi:hypothetical protein
MEDNNDWSNYCGISLLPTTYRILSSIILSRLNLHIDEIIVDQQYGFWCNWTTTHHIVCTHQKLEKKWDYKETS